MPRTSFFLVLSIALLSSSVASEGAEAGRPNIVFILADDMGSGDPSPLNPNSKIPTPAFDRLASEGMTFTDAHSGSAVCTPTRYGVICGRYAWRTRLKRGVLNGYSSHLIDPKRPTVASILKKSGYTTAAIGKWHLGWDWAAGEKPNSIDYSKPVKNGPAGLGFDRVYLIPASLDFAPYVYLDGDTVTALPTEEQPASKFPNFMRQGPRSPDFVPVDCLDHLLSKSVEFIAEQAGKEEPFFLYFPLTAPHKPALPHPRFRGKSELGDYGDFVVQVDWTVGQILEVLDEKGIADDTLVIYTSDNGSYMYRLDEGETGHVDDSSVQGFLATRHTANGELRGTKADVWEAGHRVPFFARWPKGIKAGTKCAETICLTDFFATAAELAGAEVPEGTGEDSFSIVPLMKGGEMPSKRPHVINHSASGMFAIRDGKWKLVLGNGSGGRQQPKGKPFSKPYELYDLDEDLGESKNLADSHPEVVDRLTKAFAEIAGSDAPAP